MAAMEAMEVMEVMMGKIWVKQVIEAMEAMEKMEVRVTPPVIIRPVQKLKMEKVLIIADPNLAPHIHSKNNLFL